MQRPDAMAPCPAKASQNAARQASKLAEMEDRGNMGMGGNVND